MNIHEEASAADRVVNDPVFIEAVNSLRSEALEKLLATAATDVDGIRDTQSLVKALDALTGTLRGRIEAAKVSKR